MYSDQGGSEGHTQIAALLGEGAIGIVLGQIEQGSLAALDVAPELLQLGDSLVMGGLADDPPFWVLP